jgi:hypothetical protein
MRIACFVALLCSAATFAQSLGDIRLDAMRKQASVRLTEPRRPDRPARRENITDEEVREVQGAALTVFPDAIVNISTVTEGCQCEPSENCTSQVWLVLYRPSRTIGLMLSKIDGHWQVGAIQKWWLRYNEHQSTYFHWTTDTEGRAARRAWWIEEDELLDSFPGCAIRENRRI